MKKKVFQEAKPSLRVASHKEGQTSTDSRIINLQLLLPQSLQLVCKLVKISPEKIMKDFMTVLSHQPLCPSRNDRPQMLLVDYFLAMAYGQSNYSGDDIRQMFSELRAIDELWPDGTDEKFMSMHCKWREEYLQYWLEKWQKKAY